MFDFGFSLERDGSADSKLIFSGNRFQMENAGTSIPSARCSRPLPLPFIDLDRTLSYDIEKVSITDHRCSSPVRVCSSDKRNKRSLGEYPSAKHHSVVPDTAQSPVNPDHLHRERHPWNSNAVLSSDIGQYTSGSCQTLNSAIQSDQLHDNNSTDSGAFSLDGDSPMPARGWCDSSASSSSSTVKTLHFSDDSDPDQESATATRTRIKDEQMFRSNQRKNTAFASSTSSVRSPAFSAVDKSASKRDSVGQDVLQPRKKRVLGKCAREVRHEPVSSGSLNIMSMLDCEADNLIGDLSRTYCLPTRDGQHPDLRCISPRILAELLTGRYLPQVDQCRIVDCRYPFEYSGGHISGATNVWSRDQLSEKFSLSGERDVARETAGRRIVVFYCEFSSERGPKMCRLLRKLDREASGDAYPSLHYPELYLLDGGYKAFYEQCKGMCEPQSYKPMVHSDHVDDVKYFRGRSKAVSGQRSSRVQSRRHLFQ